ncbi:MAG: hypothetical protein DA405_05985 [Bacteroidetes bacterium]|jgi:hypothetical protein|nr:MAG: hypothetical protein DA405_05985 [Bacteroidota bacterium]
MESDKQKIAEGIRFLAVALPLVFSGPALYVGLGMPALRNGNYLWVIISIVIMLIAVFLMVKGLRRVLSGFFND